MEPPPFIESRLTHLDGRRALFGRLTISDDAVRVSGWTTAGRQSRSMALSSITSVDTPWHGGRAGLVVSAGEEQVVLRLAAGSMLWKTLIQSAAGRDRVEHAAPILHPAAESDEARRIAAPGRFSELARPARTGTGG